MGGRERRRKVVDIHFFSVYLLLPSFLYPCFFFFLFFSSRDEQEKGRRIRIRRIRKRSRRSYKRPIVFRLPELSRPAGDRLKPWAGKRVLPYFFFFFQNRFYAFLILYFVYVVIIDPTKCDYWRNAKVYFRRPSRRQLPELVQLIFWSLRQYSLRLKSGRPASYPILSKVCLY